ncbi:MAG: hypothetical protein KGJ14_09660, partial [Nitrospirota bacterium]|nr:hypothetical protein [Nitrospirota bacterium]
MKPKLRLLMSLPPPLPSTTTPDRAGLTIPRRSPIFRPTCRSCARHRPTPPREVAMYIWSKRLVIGLLAAFGLLLILFVVEGQ